ncbi:hypothetical protein F5B21DRAFT_188776 [Xylaria acuta]|nr:hypothetical protein F5B21DRAFT_188776 [Xylaria acuta]
MVDSRSQDIIKELAKLYSNANDNTKGLVQNIASLATQVNAKLDKSNIETQTRSEQTVLSVAKLSEKVERGARQFSEKSQQRRRYDALLKTLFFPEMKERRASIKDAAPGTLEWVFAPLKPLGSALDNVDASATHVTWDGFGEWLCNHSSVYWICGKLGSGKSTLMYHG